MSSLKVATVRNDSEGLAYIADLRKQARLSNRWGRISTRVRIYGRCHNKVDAFAKTGRRHSRNSNSNSIYSPKSPEARYCYAWAVYLVMNVKPIKSQAYPDGDEPRGSMSGY